MKTLTIFLEQLKSLVDVPLFRLGNNHFTLWTIFYLIVLIALLVFVTGKIKKYLVDSILVRRNVQFGVRQAIGTIMQYILLFIGLLIILQTAGIDLTALNVLAGAVGIGLGFGLQTIVNEFLSGLIILFERPIKIGDRIEVGNVEGAVVEIRPRSTTVVTNDNIAIIIPNSKFISENVINWSYRDQKVRFKIPVSVAYGSDTRLVEKLLLEVAKENPDVLDDPAPVVRFMEFGDSGLLFEVRAWSISLVHKKGKLISDLNFAIDDKFRKFNIEIPYPQRDLHIRSGSVNAVNVENRAGQGEPGGNTNIPDNL